LARADGGHDPGLATMSTDAPADVPTTAAATPAVAPDAAPHAAHRAPPSGRYGVTSMPTESRSDAAPVVQSVDRAIVVMEILAARGWTGVSELARELDIHRSTAFRLLSTLERRGVVEQHGATQKYRLGFALVRLATAVRGSLDLSGAARDVCERLSLETDETVTVAVLDGREVLNVHQVNLSSHRVNVDWVGSHGALHGTASGKAFLAHLPERTLDAILAGPLEAFTSATIVEPEELRRDLGRIRDRGYAVTREELEEGLNAVAAPVRNHDGTIAGTLSVSGPSYRLQEDRLRWVAELTVEAAEEVGQRLGYRSANGERVPV
jgi:IclR family transcriptional regulator, acetate operon repressor